MAEKVKKVKSVKRVKNVKGEISSKNSAKVLNDQKIKLEIENPIAELFKTQLPKQVILIVIIILLLIFGFLNFDKIYEFFIKIMSILTPIIIGWALAFIMSPLYNSLVVAISNKKEAWIKNFAKPIATIICTLVVVGLGIGLIFLLVPQLYSSIVNFANRTNVYMNTVTSTINDLDALSDSDYIKQLLERIESVIKDVIKGTTEIDFSKIFKSLFSGFYISLKAVLNIFIGLVVMMYSLNMKEEFIHGLKRILFAIFKADVAKKIIIEAQFAKKMFSGFFIGKLLDSLIIGILCYICCFIMQMPYTPLISVIIGVTNIIPFFGPFIGAIPSFALILLEEPLSWKPYGFLLFILLLQQLDGNVIGPKILGSSTGVGSFWVLFSIILFGGLFGFIGMIIAVPTWAVITRLFDEFVTIRLKAKEHNANDEEYFTFKSLNSSLTKEET